MLPAEFEIPDDWIAEAGIAGFVKTGETYRSTPSATMIPLREIEPPFRHPEVLKDFSRL